MHCRSSWLHRLTDLRSVARSGNTHLLRENHVLLEAELQRRRQLSNPVLTAGLTAAKPDDLQRVHQCKDLHIALPLSATSLDCLKRRRTFFKEPRFYDGIEIWPLCLAVEALEPIVDTA